MPPSRADDHFRVLVELDLEIVEVRLLERRGDDPGGDRRVCENHRRMRKIERAREPSREKMENLLRGEISHDFMENVDEVPARLILIANALKLGLRLPESRTQRLHLVPV